MRVTLLGGAVEIDGSYLDAPPAAVRRQVAAYARGDRRTFDLGVAYPDGFLGRVMEAMRTIPYGETRTYGAVADDLDTAAVAVGRACGANPVPLVVPCHRVVGVDGLRGYSGEGGVALKRALLAHEGAAVGGSADGGEPPGGSGVAERPGAGDAGGGGRR